PAPEPPARGEGAMPAAPAARKIMAEEGLTAAEVGGTGRRGQILKEDAMAAAARREAVPAAAAAAASSVPAKVPVPAQQIRAPSAPNDAGRAERVEQTRRRPPI